MDNSYNTLCQHYFGMRIKNLVDSSHQPGFLLKLEYGQSVKIGEHEGFNISCLNESGEPVKRNKTGSRPVAWSEGLFFKPEIKEKTNKEWVKLNLLESFNTFFHYLLFGRGVPLLCIGTLKKTCSLNNQEEKLVICSQYIKGVSLKQYINDEKNVSSLNFSFLQEHIISNLIMRPSDARPSNYIIDKNLCLYSIDREDFYANDAIEIDGCKEIGLKDSLFMLDNVMQNFLMPDVRKKILAINIETLCSDLMKFLVSQKQRFDELLKNRPDIIAEHENNKSTLVSNIDAFVQKITQIKELVLSLNTLDSIFEKTEREIYKHYKNIREDHSTIRNRINALFGMDDIDKYVFR